MQLCKGIKCMSSINNTLPNDFNSQINTLKSELNEIDNSINKICLICKERYADNQSHFSSIKTDLHSELKKIKKIDKSLKKISRRIDELNERSQNHSKAEDRALNKLLDLKEEMKAKISLNKANLYNCFFDSFKKIFPIFEKMEYPIQNVIDLALKNKALCQLFETSTDEDLNKINDLIQGSGITFKDTNFLIRSLVPVYNKFKGNNDQKTASALTLTLDFLNKMQQKNIYTYNDMDNFIHFFKLEECNESELEKFAQILSSLKKIELPSGEMKVKATYYNFLMHSLKILDNADLKILNNFYDLNEKIKFLTFIVGKSAEFKNTIYKILENQKAVDIKKCETLIRILSNTRIPEAENLIKFWIDNFNLLMVIPTEMDVKYLIQAIGDYGSVDKAKKNFENYLGLYENKWLNYIVKNDGFSSSSLYHRNERENLNSSYQNQMPYGQLMHQSTNIITNLILERQKESDSFPSLEELLSECATRRQLMAWQCNHQEAELFGIYRNIRYGTPLSDLYSDLGKKLNEKLKAHSIDSPLDLTPGKSGLIKENENESVIQAKVEGEVIDLTRIRLNKKLIEHTEPKEIEKILKHVDTLYEELINEKDHDKAKELAGVIFWWLCQTKPWKRGDPSIAEIFIRGVLNAKGIPLAGWKTGIIPWAEATLEFDVDLFGKNFHTLFEG